MKPTTWTIVFLSVVASCFGSVAFLNWWANPTFLFNHESTLLKQKQTFDERLQKTNAVKFGKRDYDTILLGSSMSTYINQNHFKHNRVFNYSASLMRPEEFPVYLKYFKQENGDGVTKIILSADFREYFVQDRQINPPEFYVDQVSAPGYRVKQLINLSELLITLKAIKYQITGHPGRYYEPGNVANIARRGVEAVEQEIIEGLQAENYRNLLVDSKYESHLDSTIEAAGESEIIVFTSPCSHFRTNLFFERGKQVEYGEWLKLLIRKFGKVYHFADINSITSNHKIHYYDSYHFYPHVGDMIIEFIESDGNVRVDDFGIVLTTVNIEEYLSTLSND